MKSIEAEFLVKVEKACAKLGLGGDTRILVAVSAGPDSTALALALSELSERLGFGLVLGYYNHALRTEEEAREELGHVMKLSETLNVPLAAGASGAGELRGRAEREGRSLEDAARESRYRFLREAMEREGCTRIALGHTKNDQIETRVIRFFQGSGASGLKGIPPKRGVLVRPLLAVSREEVLAFLKSRNQAYCTDRSNADPAYLRNRVRRDLLPVVEAVFPGYGKALAKASLKARLVDDFLRDEVGRRNPFRKTEGGYSCPREAFAGLHPLLRLQAAYDLYDKTAVGGRSRLPFAFLNPLLRPRLKSGDGVLLKGYGIELSARGEELFWCSDIVLDRKKSYLYVIDGSMNVDILGMVRVQIEEAGPESSSEEGLIRCGSGDFLLLRSRRQGDVIRTSGGTKTLKKLFSDLKIPERFRDLVPIVQDSREILGVFAGPFGSRTIYSPKNMVKEHGRNFRFRVFGIGEERG